MELFEQIHTQTLDTYENLLKNNEEYMELSEKYSAKYASFLKKLDGSAADEFIDLMEAKEELEGAADLLSFAFAFSTGLELNKSTSKIAQGINL